MNKVAKYEGINSISMNGEINMEKYKMYARYLRVFSTMQKFMEVYTIGLSSHPYTQEKFYALYYMVKKIVEVCNVMLDNDIRAKTIRDNGFFSQSMENKLYNFLWNCDPIDDREVDVYFCHIEDYLENGGNL